MLRTEIDRRTVLAGLGSLVPGLTLSMPAYAAEARIVGGAIKKHDGSFAAVLYDLDKGVLRNVALPGRGHDIAFSKSSRQCVVFARRPGNFALAFDVDGGTPPVAFTTPPTHHFYGHGVFSSDGRLLFTTENEIATGDGTIGVWDVAAPYARIGTFPAFGIGPHDLALLADGRTLVVAIGGIATHPDAGRKPLNLGTMQPALVYIETRTGARLEQQQLPPSLHRNSIRHLAVSPDDTVVFGCQFKGARSEHVELLGTHRRGEDLRLLDTGSRGHQALRHYVSSLAVDQSGLYAAATSSRGRAVALIDLKRRRLVSTMPFPDASGIAPARSAGAFVVTGGTGLVGITSNAEPVAECDWAWDNHLASL